MTRPRPVPTIADDKLRIGTRYDGGSYVGVIRRGPDVAAECGHRHANRDQSTQRNGLSARDCVTQLVRAARYPEYAAELRGRILGGPARYARVWQATAGTLARMNDEAAEQAAAFTASLPAVAELIGDEPVLGFNDNVAVAPPQPEEAGQ